MWQKTQNSAVVAALLWSLFTFPATAQERALTRAAVLRLENQVQILPYQRSPRPAAVQDVLVPRDGLRTGTRSRAELLFNEGSLARVGSSAVFRFTPGLRRIQVTGGGVRAEVIFQLQEGVALIVSPPGAAGTQVETPESRIFIRADAQTAIAPAPLLAWHPGSPGLPLLSQAVDLPALPDDSSAVMVAHDAATDTTQVFALTDGDIVVSTASGSESAALLGGQTIAVRGGRLGDVREFDLEAFYQTVALAAGLGAGQEAQVEQNAAAQTTLDAARTETLAAIARQADRLSGFAGSFLQDALSGSDRSFDGQRQSRQENLSNGIFSLDGETTFGTFVRTGENTAIFTDSAGNVTEIVVDFDDRSIQIDGNAGAANSVGLSGRNASGTVVNPNGQATQIRIFGVNEEEPEIEVSYPGSLTRGTAIDR